MRFSYIVESSEVVEVVKKLVLLVLRCVPSSILTLFSVAAAVMEAVVE